MTTINYVAIRQDGRTITGQQESSFEAAAELRKMFQDAFYNTMANPIKTVFLSDGSDLLQYLPSEIQDVRNWEEGR